MNTDKVTRFEVIGPHGRMIVLYEVKIELSYQDDGRTLKVFVKDRAAKFVTDHAQEIGDAIEASKEDRRQGRVSESPEI